MLFSGEIIVAPNILGAGQISSAGETDALVVVAGDATINPHIAATYVLTKASAAAITLGAPSAGTDDGIQIIVTSGSNFAHVVTSTGAFIRDGAHDEADTATFAPFAGASLIYMAWSGNWLVLSLNGVTVTDAV